MSKDQGVDEATAEEFEQMKKLVLIVRMYDNTRLKTKDALKCIHDILDKKL